MLSVVVDDNDGKYRLDLEKTNKQTNKTKTKKRTNKFELQNKTMQE